MDREAHETLLEIEGIRRLVQDLPPNVQSDVYRKLSELGICQASDMKYLNPEKDLVDVLRPIQARKMMAAISDMFTTKDVNEEPVERDIAPPSPALSWTSSASSSDSLSSQPCISPSQNWVSSFRVPYHQFPPELISQCEKGERPKTPHRLEMIRILCSEISRYTRLPGKSNIEIIASKLLAKYPQSFTEKIGTEVLGTGHAGLVRQILDRMANAYGRGAASKRSHSENISTEDRSPVAANKNKDSYGCINFSPTNLPANESEDSLTEMKQSMMHEAQNRDEALNKQYMEKTYVLQRRSINQNPPLSIVAMKEEWPLLFNCDYLLKHFETLTGINIQQKLHSSLADKAPRLLKFIIDKRSKGKGVKPWIDRILMTGGLNNDTQCLIIPLLSASFGEDPRLLIKIYEETVNTAEVENDADNTTPYIAVIGDICGESSKYFLVVEKSVVTEDIPSLEDALAMAFSAYYVFNLQYNHGLSATLEFIQRCFIDLNPAKGSRSRAKKSGVANTKVVGFLRAFETFDWHLED